MLPITISRRIFQDSGILHFNPRRAVPQETRELSNLQDYSKTIMSNQSNIHNPTTILIIKEVLKRKCILMMTTQSQNSFSSILLNISLVKQALITQTHFVSL